MFSKTDAERLAAGLEMREAHRALLDHWLSLWPGDALPSRALLSPAKLKYYLPSLLLFDTVPDRSVTIRLAGTRILRTLKTELTGPGWIALGPKSSRAERLRLFSRMARGAFGLGHRRIPLTFGQHYISEELILPFAEEPSGITPLLCHLDGDADPHVEIHPIDEALGVPLDFKLVPLPRAAAAA